jgi:hypothetical protein
MASKATSDGVDKGQAMRGDKQEPMDLKKLAAPFPIEEIQWRVGSTTLDKTKGIALAYYDARALYDRLDEVCGPANWQIKYPHANGKTCADIGIKVNGEWVWKSNGAGDTDFEGEKGAFSDAAKRAGVPWGIGRYLYEMKNTWVAIEQAGKSYKIKDSEKTKLEAAYRNFLSTGSMKGHIAPMDKTGNPAVDRAVMDAIQHIKNAVDKESATTVGRYQWKLLKDSGATDEQLDLIQSEVEKQHETFNAKGN